MYERKYSYSLGVFFREGAPSFKKRTEREVRLPDSGTNEYIGGTQHPYSQDKQLYFLDVRAENRDFSFTNDNKLIDYVQENRVESRT